MDETGKVEELRKSIYKSMSAEQKLVEAAELYYASMNLKKAHLKRSHPEWSEQKVEQKTREWMLYAKT